MSFNRFKRLDIYRSTKLYLAAPYSCPFCKNWENLRFEMVNIAAMTLINAGYVVFSPISHSHPISIIQPAERNTHELWLGQDAYFLDWADALVVLTLPGWGDSYGVAKEIGWFEQSNKPVYYLSIAQVYQEQKEQLSHDTK